VNEQRHTRAVDVLGIGAGPANLSLAALLTPVYGPSFRLVEQRSAVSWHPGLLLPGATLQVSFLKDLVTPVLPTSPFSFVSFLVEHKRFYRFTAAGYDRPSRAEFDRYLRWVASRLPFIEYDQRVEAVEHSAGVFAVRAGGRVHVARSIVLGTGPVPYVPECARRHMGKTVFHASEYAFHRFAPEQRVVIVGGGQSGAEIFLDRLNSGCNDLLWITRRSNLLPLDDSPFTNELFTPHYARRFFGLDAETRQTLLAAQRLASDGISTELLHEIYRHLYQLEYNIELDGRSPMVLPEQELAAMEPHGDGWRLVLRPVGTGQARTEYADVVVLATGYTHQLPDYMQPLVGRIRFDRQHPSLRSDFSLVWDGPEDARIYVQNAARHSHGIADPNLSLLAWRSAVIVNSLLGKDLYDVSEPHSMIGWKEG
jgi:lysine N6-hydroxylase